MSDLTVTVVRYAENGGPFLDLDVRSNCNRGPSFRRCGPSLDLSVSVFSYSENEDGC